MQIFRVSGLHVNIIIKIFITLSMITFSTKIGCVYLDVLYEGASFLSAMKEY